MSNGSSSVVVDLGTYQVRAGLADEAKPSFVHRSFYLRDSPEGPWYGPDCLYRAAVATASPCVLQPSLWDDCRDSVDGAAPTSDTEAVLRGALRRPVCRRIEDHSAFVILPDHVVDSPTQRARVAEALFESVQVPSAFLARPTLCQALEAGLPTSIVADVGYESTTIRVIADGYTLKKSIGGVFEDLGGGKRVTEALMASMAAAAAGHNKSGAGATAAGLVDYSHTAVAALATRRHGGGHHALTSHSELTTDGAAAGSGVASYAVEALLDEVKRTCCEALVTPLSKRRGVVAGSAAVDASTTDVSFVAPDGTRFSIGGVERTACYDSALFGPSAHLAQRIVNVKGAMAAQHVELQARAPLLLTGGTACAKGLPERLHAELKLLDKTFTQQQITVSRDPSLAAWRGGALICAAKPFEAMWVTRGRWLEEGASCLAASIN